MTTPHTLTRRFHVFAALLCAGLAGACGGSSSSTPPGTDVWAEVDGRRIMKDDVEKAYRRVAQTPAPSADEVLIMKLGILDELITQDLLIAKAAALKIAPTDGEIEIAYADRKKNLTEASFQQELTQRGLTVSDMRAGLRQELIAQKVIEQEVSSKIAISDQDIVDFYNANRAQFNLAEPAYRIAQILITPQRDPQITNRLNDDASTPEAADRKAQMLMDKLKGGAEFATIAMDYSEDPQSAPQGGDLGFMPASALQRVPAALRDAVLKAQPGTVSKVSADGGHNLVLLVAREAAGQRDLATPAVRESIRGALRERKEQLLRSAYLTVVRGDAKVVNYFARQLIPAQGTAPTLAPAAPGKK